MRCTRGKIDCFGVLGEGFGHDLFMRIIDDNFRFSKVMDFSRFD